jgi:hypothetical protein
MGPLRISHGRARAPATVVNGMKIEVMRTPRSKKKKAASKGKKS